MSDAIEDIETTGANEIAKTCLLCVKNILQSIILGQDTETKLHAVARGLAWARAAKAAGLDANDDYSALETDLMTLWAHLSVKYSRER